MRRLLRLFRKSRSERDLDRELRFRSHGRASLRMINALGMVAI